MGKLVVARGRRFRWLVAAIYLLAVVSGMADLHMLPWEEYGDYWVNMSCATDLAIDGSGWFVLREAQSASCYYTRYGEFHFDYSGYLITPQGDHVQGYCDADLTVLGDIKIDLTGAPPDTNPNAKIQSLEFDANGRIRLELDDGTSFLRGQLLLQNFRSPQRLKRIAYRRYHAPAAAGALSQPAVPLTEGLGAIQPAALNWTPEAVQLEVLPKAGPAGVLATGAVTETRLPTDLAISGRGCFLLKDPNTSELSVTRAGFFLLDRDGYLVSYDRKRVQGYTDGTRQTLGDVRIDESGAPVTASPTAGMSSFSIGRDGCVKVFLNDGTEFVRSQVLLYEIRHPDRLIHDELGDYRGVSETDLQPVEGAGSYEVGWIQQYRLELIHATDALLALRDSMKFFPLRRLVRTDVTTDLAIITNGFFELRNPGSGESAVTRYGHFHFDGAGFLVDSDGWRVQGYANPSLTIRGDIQVKPETWPEGVDLTSDVPVIRIDFDGKMYLQRTNGVEVFCGQVLLQRLRDPFVLVDAGNQRYTNVLAAGPLPQTEAVGTYGLGVIMGCVLEQQGPLESLTLPARDGVRLRITGEHWRNWTVQASQDLSEWTDISTVTNAPYEVEVNDPEAQVLSRRFYRVVVTPTVDVGSE